MNVRYISCSLHTPVAECLIYLMPYMHEVFQHSQCLPWQETQTTPLWAPPQGLVFVMNNDVMIQFRYWGSAGGSDWQDTVDHCLRLKCRSSFRRCYSQSLAAFVEVWHIWYCFAVVDWHIQDSGRWVIYCNPHIFTTFIVKAVGVAYHGRVWGYIISGELLNTASIHW
jgi:hypothetical protein